MQNNRPNISPLRSLTLQQQRQIIEWLQKLSMGETTEKIIADFGIETSRRSVGRFRDWWHTTRALEEAADYADELRARLREVGDEKMGHEQISLAAQVSFELEALKSRDLDAYVNLRKLRQRDKAIDLAQQRFVASQEADQTSAASRPPINPARDWTEAERQAFLRKVDEVFGFKEPPK